MIRPLALTDSTLVDGSGTNSDVLTAHNQVSDYLYLVADCLTVVFHESKSLGLSDSDLMETANRYLDEARTSLRAVAGQIGEVELPSRLGTPDEIPAAATELSRRARVLEEAGYWESIS